MRTILFFCFCLTLSVAGLQPKTAAAQEDRRDYTAGTGHSAGGFSGTYVDPDSGDEVTTIIAPRAPSQQQEWPPIYIYPQVTPSWPPQPGPMPGPLLSPNSQRQGEWQSPFQYGGGR